MIEGLTDEEKILFQAIKAAKGKSTVKALLPEFSRSTEDKPSITHQQLRSLRNKVLIHPFGGSRWEEDKRPVVTQFAELVLILDPALLQTGTH